MVVIITEPTPAACVALRAKGCPRTKLSDRCSVTQLRKGVIKRMLSTATRGRRWPRRRCRSTPTQWTPTCSGWTFWPEGWTPRGGYTAAACSPPTGACPPWPCRWVGSHGRRHCQCRSCCRQPSLCWLAVTCSVIMCVVGWSTRLDLLLLGVGLIRGGGGGFSQPSSGHYHTSPLKV